MPVSELPKQYTAVKLVDAQLFCVSDLKKVKLQDHGQRLPMTTCYALCLGRKFVTLSYLKNPPTDLQEQQSRIGEVLSFQRGPAAGVKTILFATKALTEKSRDIFNLLERSIADCKKSQWTLYIDRASFEKEKASLARLKKKCTRNTFQAVVLNADNDAYKLFRRVARVDRVRSANGSYLKVDGRRETQLVAK